MPNLDVRNLHPTEDRMVEDEKRKEYKRLDWNLVDPDSPINLIFDLELPSDLPAESQTLLEYRLNRITTLTGEGKLPYPSQTIEQLEEWIRENILIPAGILI